MRDLLPLNYSWTFLYFRSEGYDLPSALARGWRLPFDGLTLEEVQRCLHYRQIGQQVFDTLKEFTNWPDVWPIPIA